MKVININKCFECPNNSRMFGKYGYCSITGESIPYFTTIQKQILDTCPLPDALTNEEIKFIQKHIKK